MKTSVKLHLLASAAKAELAQRIRRARHNERGDVTSTVIIIAVLVAAAVAAGVVITTYVSGQTSKIS